MDHPICLSNINPTRMGKKAIKDGTKFDIYSSSLIIIGYAIPGFLFAIFLIVIFAGGSYLRYFSSEGISFR